MVKSALKVIVQLALIWVALAVILSWNLIFHDSSGVSDFIVDQLLIRTQLSRDQIEIRHSHSDPPSFAGDSAQAVCAEPSRSLDASAFVAGSSLDPDPSSLGLADLIASTSGFVPTSQQLLTDRYAVRILQSEFDKLVFLYVPTDENLVCYVTVKI